MIKNHTSEVDAEKTIGQITTLLMRKGARRIAHDFDAEGKIIALDFALEVYGQVQSFRVPVNVEGVYQVMLKAEPWNFRRNLSELAYMGKLRLQARRTAWRILKDWLEAQLAVVEAGQAEMTQVFLPYMLHAQSGQTMWQAWDEQARKRLGSGE